MAKKPQRIWSTTEVHEALRTRFAPPEWVYAEECMRGTGWHANRRMDFLAMNTWPSRGLSIVGVEVKASRQDWLRELRKPEKQEELFQFCDFFYLAVGSKELVKDGELPANWGLLAPRGKQLVEVVKAPPLEPKPVDKLFMAAVFRRLFTEPPGAADLRIAYEQGRKEGLEIAEGSTQRSIQWAEQDKKRAEGIVERFERQTGLSFSNWHGGEERIVKAVKLLMELDRSNGISDVEKIANQARAASQRFDDLLAVLKRIEGGVLSALVRKEEDQADADSSD